VEIKKLQIVPEKEGGNLQFDEGAAIGAMFNPDELSFSGSVGWQKQKAAQRDVPELQFTSSEPRTVSVKLLFDTYDTPDLPKKDVRKEYTDKLLKLTLVQGDKHRPPVCQLRWGGGQFFQCVLERLDQRFTLFMDDGTPVRAVVTCAFKEWRTNHDDLQRQARQSSDIVKVKVLRRGDTLSSIAAEEYLDPAKWRPIAVANSIDDPLRLAAGRSFTVPKLPLNPKRPTT
jgi:nucleoid-associated protein YgaU